MNKKSSKIGRSVKNNSRSIADEFNTTQGRIIKWILVPVAAALGAYIGFALAAWVILPASGCLPCMKFGGCPKYCYVPFYLMLILPVIFAGTGAALIAPKYKWITGACVVTMIVAFALFMIYIDN